MPANSGSSKRRRGRGRGQGAGGRAGTNRGGGGGRAASRGRAAGTATAQTEAKPRPAAEARAATQAQLQADARAASAISLAPLSFEAEGLGTVIAVAGKRARISRDADPDGLLCCWECTAVPSKLLACSRCKVARYCSKACQKAAWRAEFTGVGHKDTCKTFLENLRPEGETEDQGKCAAISAAGSSWISCGRGHDDDELQVCMEAREQAFLADTAVPGVLHLLISCTNALNTVRLGISASFFKGRPMYAMDLVYMTLDEGAHAEALIEQRPSGTLRPAARARAMDTIVQFAERAAAAGKGGHIKAILLGRGLPWLADEHGPEHGSLLARLRAAGLNELFGMHLASNHTMVPMVDENTAAARGGTAPPVEDEDAGSATATDAHELRAHAERLAPVNSTTAEGLQVRKSMLQPQGAEPEPGSGQGSSVAAPVLHFSRCGCGCDKRLPPFTDRPNQTAAYHRRLMNEAGVTDPDAAEAGVCRGKLCCPCCDAELSISQKGSGSSTMNCGICKLMIIDPAAHATVAGSAADKAQIAKDQEDAASYESFMAGPMGM